MVFYTKIVMRLLLFLQRVTFICNILFILCLIIRYTHNFISNEDLKSSIIILGWALSFILGFVVHLWELIILYNQSISIVPKWLRITNFLIFIFQLIYFLY